MKRRGFMAVAALAAMPPVAGAQQTRRVPVVGFLTPGFAASVGPGTPWLSLKEGLRANGYVEGESVRLEPRWGEGNSDAMPQLAAELVRLKVDVIVAAARPSIIAAKAATRDLPLVALDLESDPIESGFVSSLAAPGGNLTGLFLDLPDLAGKWLQLITEVVPDARRIAVMWDENTGEAQLRAITSAARALSIDRRGLGFRDSPALERLLDDGLAEPPHAIVQLGSPLIYAMANRIALQLARRRIPAISLYRSFPDGGGIMSYGPVLPTWYRRLGRYVSVILRGAKPAEMPVERPTSFELVINQKAALAMRLVIPTGMLLRADEVIE